MPIQNLVEVVNKGTNSVNQMRNIMFLPYDNIKNSTLHKDFQRNGSSAVIFENDHFKLEIEGGLLSQFHRDILDIVFAEGRLKPMAGERGYVQFSIYNILKRLGLSDAGKNYKTVEQKLKELKKVSFVLTSKKGLFNGDWIAFSLCDRAEYSDKLKEFVLIFSDSYLNMFQSDVLVNYNEYVKRLVAIKGGTVKAFVRYVISNDWINHSLDTLLEELEIKRTNMTDRNFNKIKKSIRDSKDLETFGIKINEDEIVTYKKPKDIFFFNVKKELGKQSTINFGK